ncbi:MAG: tetratricopeptide repeat protein [bacterium]
MIKKIAIGIFGLAFLICSVVFVNEYNKHPLPKNALQELAFFPSGPLIKIAVFHYDNFFADIYWMQSLQYIGKHLSSDKTFNLLYHIYDVVTRLDPRFIDAYNFGAIMLAQYGRDKTSAMDLLKLGLKRAPDSWEIPFQAGFISYVIYKNYNQALKYFRMADKKPVHKKIVDEYIAFLNAKIGNIEIALHMWTDMYNKSNDNITKAICMYNILRLEVEKYKNIITQAVNRYKAEEHHLPEDLGSLVSKGYLSKIPSVLSWKPFQYDPKTGQVITPDITWKDVALYQNSLNQ